MIIEKRNATPRLLLEKARKIIEGENFSWFYQNNTAYSNSMPQFDELHNGSFSHIAVMDERKNSISADCLEDILLTILDPMGKELNKLHRIRIALIPIGQSNFVNHPHVDVPYNHTVGLLYLNDSDGDTIIYNERFNPYGTLDVASYYEDTLNRQVTELKRITPEENKFVMFDGTHFHSSSTPAKTKKRLTVNFVFEAHDR